MITIAKSTAMDIFLTYINFMLNTRVPTSEQEFINLRELEITKSYLCNW